MKKFFTRALKFVLFLLGFVIALWNFLPYPEIGRALMSVGYSRLNENNMKLSYSDITGVDGGFTVNNLAIEGNVNITFGSITIRPQIISSILSLGGVCNIDFRNANIILGQNFNIGDGHFLMTAFPKEILLEELRTNGDFRLNGYLTINLNTMKIGQAEASLNVPEEFAGGLGLLRNFLPLEQDNSGQWHLRRR